MENLGNVDKEQTNERIQPEKILPENINKVGRVRLIRWPEREVENKQTGKSEIWPESLKLRKSVFNPKTRDWEDQEITISNKQDALAIWYILKDYLGL
ncbi:MAG: hypothetical protein ACTSW1_07360 [Candidatus Hodarchaeales archaeon]